MTQNAPLFTVDELAAAVDRGLSKQEIATEFGCSSSLVGMRLRRLRIERGETVGAAHDQTWDSKLRPRPTRKQVLDLLASHGTDACVERWGEKPHLTLKRARP